MNEKSTGILTVSFFDENGVAVIPTAATFSVADLLTSRTGKETLGTVITIDTAISPLAAVVEIPITVLHTTIQNIAKTTETRLVTIKFDYGIGKKGTSEYRFTVTNMLGVS